MSSYSTSQAAVRSFVGLCSPPLSSTFTQILNMLDTAAEQMMVHKDFQEVFDTCAKGLERLSNMESEDSRCAELKSGFCILGIQALAELNQWREVQSWVLQQYEKQEKVPAKIMQMCILLYSKVGDPAVMQDAARRWLLCPSNRAASGFGTVSELYLLHVLLPLGQTDEARGFITSEAGGAAFTDDQRQTALEVIEETEKQNQNPPQNPDPDVTAHPVSTQGGLIHRLEAVLKFLHRKFLLPGSGSFPLRKLFLFAVLLYMLLVRLDPALPSSFLWISKLLQLLRQMWAAMFGPYYQTFIEKDL